MVLIFYCRAGLVAGGREVLFLSDEHDVVDVCADGSETAVQRDGDIGQWKCFLDFVVVGILEKDGISFFVISFLEFIRDFFTDGGDIFLAVERDAGKGTEMCVEKQEGELFVWIFLEELFLCVESPLQAVFQFFVLEEVGELYHGDNVFNIVRRGFLPLCGRPSWPWR